VKTIPDAHPVRASRSTLRPRISAALCCLLIAGAASACSSARTAKAGASGGSTGSSSGCTKRVNIAMFLVASANTHQQAALKGAKAALAATCNVSLHDFSANFDPTTQVNQVQAAVASGQYDAVLVNSVDGTAMIPAIDQALAKGIKVVCGFSICGPDQSKFAKEIPGVVAQIASDYQAVGKAAADALEQGCAKQNPCNTVYMDGTPTLAADQTFKQGFDNEVKKFSNVKIVATGQGQFAAGPALTSMKDILQAHPDIQAVASVSDQEISGVQQALAESPLAGKHVVLVGDGASDLAKAGMLGGVWYASAILRPYNEGFLEAQDAIAAVRGKAVTDDLVNSSLTPAYPDGYVSTVNAAKWTPEWTG
jgi:ribose transport system substrate-binding protein